MQFPVRILMLEDSPIDAELIQRQLRQTGWDCQYKVVSNPTDYLTALDNFNPDIILSDNAMPQFTGSEALQLLKKRPGLIPFILVTGTMSEEFAVDIIKQGADDYILKENLTRLPSAIEAVMRQHVAERERRVVQEKLILSERKYRSLVESIQDGFLALDKDWRVLFINSKAEEMMQRTPGTMAGLRMDEEFPSAIERPIFQTYRHVLHTNKPEMIEEFSPLFQRWLRVFYYPSQFGVSIIFHDITEQKETEERVRLSEEKYKIFVERITDAFIALDKDWHYTYLNHQALELIQKKNEEVLGKRVWDIFPEAVGSATYRSMVLAMNEQRFVHCEDYFPPLDLWQENYIYPSPDGLSMFIRNISERKKLELALQEQKRKEQQRITASALAAQEKERNAIAVELHDNVNQILVGTNLLMTIIRDNPGRSAELIGSCIDSIKTAIAENRKIAHELVSPNLESESLLEQTRKLAQKMFEPLGIGVQFENSAFEEERLVPDQKLAVYRILQEQCTNIVKYASASRVEVGLQSANGLFRMRIADDGVGMNQNQVIKGIGLQNIAARLHVFDGQLQIQTAPGKGFILQVEMPHFS